MGENLMVSDADVVCLAAEVADGQVFKVVGIFEGDADGNGEWRSEGGTYEFRKIMDMYDAAERYQAGYAPKIGGITYTVAIKFSVAMRADEAHDLAKKIGAKFSGSADPITVIADAMKMAKERIAIDIGIVFHGAQYTLYAIRVDRGEMVTLPEPIRITEAGVSAACRAHGWRSDGPYHMGGNKYAVLFFPGVQDGDTISARTDLQDKVYEEQRAAKKEVAEREVAEKTIGWDVYLPKGAGNGKTS